MQHWNGEPSLPSYTLKKNKYLREYKAQIGFHIHCTSSWRPSTCKLGLTWSMPLNEYIVLTRLCVFRNTKCLMQWHMHSSFYKAITDCKSYRAVGKNCHLCPKASKEQQTVLAPKTETHGRQWFPPGRLGLLGGPQTEVESPGRHSAGRGPLTAQPQSDCLHETLGGPGGPSCTVTRAATGAWPPYAAPLPPLFSHNPIFKNLLDQ